MKSALIQFSVENFLSFRDKVTFSMQAQGSLIPDTFFNVGLDGHRMKVFKTGFIYGSNASGKTNVLKVLQFIDAKIEKSFSDSEKDSLKSRPFLFDKNTQDQPSFFEVIFQSNERLYRYNFSILNNIILTENLYLIKTTKEKILFERNEQEINFFEELLNDNNLKDVANQKTKPYSLFISAAKEWIENDIISEVAGFFENSLSSICVLKETYGWYTMERILSDSKFKQKVLEYLKMADFCVDDVSVEMRVNEVADDSGNVKKKFRVEFNHPVFDKGEKVSGVNLNLAQESYGTEAFFKVLGPIIDTLEKGNILLVDELNASLHPHLCKFLIDLFHNPITNPEKAQLLSTLHDTTLLGYANNINRDQIWFTERDKHGVTSLYSLNEFEVRNGDRNYQAKYLNGRFGAIPFIQR